MTRLPDIDLNLLVVLDTLLKERNVTQAAISLGTTQSTLSSALARLRKVIGDPLFVRAPRGITPTPRALAIEKPLHETLAKLLDVLQPVEFDPSASNRIFVFAATDYLQFVMAGPLMRRIQELAPRVQVIIQPIAHHFPWEELANGELDFVLAGYSQPPEGLQSRLLFKDEVVCLLRKGHPSLERPFDQEAYLALSHIEVQALVGPTLVNQQMAALGLDRHISLTVPHFLSAPFAVLETDLCFTLARRIAEPLAAAFPLEVVPYPFESPSFQVRQFWHLRMQDDPSHRWLRGVMAGLTLGEES